MTKEEMEVRLTEELKKLNEAAEHVVSTNGYTAESKKVRLLVELIKEQLKNENANSTTCTVR